MGNLGRAIFSASTSRMWPFSYNEKVFNSSNQRISACDLDPGHGLNPNEDRGAPEIDLLKGGGSAISLGPGIPQDFRTIYPSGEGSDCIYTFSCTTKGANGPDIPTTAYASRSPDICKNKNEPRLSTKYCDSQTVQINGNSAD